MRIAFFYGFFFVTQWALAQSSLAVVIADSCAYFSLNSLNLKNCTSGLINHNLSKGNYTVYWKTDLQSEITHQRQIYLDGQNSAFYELVKWPNNAYRLRYRGNQIPDKIADSLKHFVPKVLLSYLKPVIYQNSPPINDKYKKAEESKIKKPDSAETFGIMLKSNTAISVLKQPITSEENAPKPEPNTIEELGSISTDFERLIRAKVWAKESKDLNVNDCIAILKLFKYDYLKLQLINELFPIYGHQPWFVELQSTLDFEISRIRFRELLEPKTVSP